MLGGQTLGDKSHPTLQDNQSGVWDAHWQIGVSSVVLLMGVGVNPNIDPPPNTQVKGGRPSHLCLSSERDKREFSNRNIRLKLEAKRERLKDGENGENSGDEREKKG